MVMSPTEMLFARYYPTSVNGTEAAIKAGIPRSEAQAEARRLMNRPVVRAEVQKHINHLVTKLDVDWPRLLRHHLDILFAELPIPSAGACRHCWGDDFQYQFTLDEFRRQRVAHIISQRKLPERHRVPFDERGGLGFDRTRPPNADCTECNGVGVNYPMVVDPSRLSSAQIKALDEVRAGKDGITLRMRNRDQVWNIVEKLISKIPGLDRRQTLEQQVDQLLEEAVDRGMINLSGPLVEAASSDYSVAHADLSDLYPEDADASAED